MRVVTWNVQTARPNPDGPADVDLAVDCLRSLEADVYAIQELDRGRSRSGGVDQAAVLAERLDATLVFAPTVTDEGHYGIALLARRPIIRSYELALSGTREPRVALIAELDADGVVWTVAATHLSRRRSVAADQLARVLSTLAGHGLPRVLLGDLNLSRRRVTPIATEHDFLVVDGPSTHSTRQRRLTSRIDHVVVAGASIEASDTHRFPVSDHCAVTATLAPT